jgi:hypothetical protein
MKPSRVARSTPADEIRGRVELPLPLEGAGFPDGADGGAAGGVEVEGG